MARSLAENGIPQLLPLKVVAMVSGNAISRSAFSIAGMASLSDFPGFRLNEIVDRRKLALVRDRKWNYSRGHAGECAQWHQLT